MTRRVTYVDDPDGYCGGHPGLLVDHDHEWHVHTANGLVPAADLSDTELAEHGIGVEYPDTTRCPPVFPPTRHARRYYIGWRPDGVC